jgi:GDP-4-dehydro-6-deoxy-D-mannose reductase
VRFVVTGIGGFVGPYLARVLLEAGHSLFGIVRRRGSGRRLAALHDQFPDRFPGEAIFTADILDPRAVQHAIGEIRPDGLFHLAGLTFVPAAAADPLAAHRTNFLGTLNVLQGVRDVHPACRVVYVGSGDAYGAAGNDMAELTEEVPLRPVSPYGLSKAAGDLAAFQWYWSGGDVVRARPFNHTGAGQPADFVCSSFAKQIVESEVGRRPPVLEVGNLDSVRDFTDVHDIVNGYLALWERGAGGEAYNLCSQRGMPIRTIVERLCSRARVPIEVRVMDERRRPNEVRRLVGSYAKAEAQTGWCPRHQFEETLDGLLGYWRDRCAPGGETTRS